MMFKMILLVLTLMFVVGESECARLSSENAWGKLVHGNTSFIKNSVYRLERLELVKEQNPFVIALSCSDSRIPPEIAFQQGLGDMFTVRNAGHVVDDSVLGSIEYAVEHFETVLIVVLGHENCGAVTAALNGLKNESSNPQMAHAQIGHLDAVIDPIQLAIRRSGIDVFGSDALEKSIKANTSAVTEQLVKRSSIIAQAVQKGRLTIVPAFYHLGSGLVEKLAPAHKNFLPGLIARVSKNVILNAGHHV